MAEGGWSGFVWEPTTTTVDAWLGETSVGGIVGGSVRESTKAAGAETTRESDEVIMRLCMIWFGQVPFTINVTCSETTYLQTHERGAERLFLRHRK